MHKGITDFYTSKRLLIGLLVSLFLALPLSAQEETEIEEIVVIGVRSSIEKSIDEKRNADGIKDVITAEDIGQLPDENIAEALQRVTGIQMARTAEGEGSTIQIRGISDNNVQINGQDFVGGVGDRSVNFRDIPSELFSGIEVLKTPSASMTEGSLGGSVNFKTRRPLEIQRDSLGSVNVKGKYADITKNENQHPLDHVPDINVFGARNFRDTKIGDIGILVNVGRKLIITRADDFGGGDYGSAPAVWARYHGDQALSPSPGALNRATMAWNSSKVSLLDPNGDGTRDAKDVYYAPAHFTARSRYSETVNNSVNMSLQWQPSYSLNFFADYVFTDTDQDRYGSQLQTTMPRSNVIPLTYNPPNAGCPASQAGCEDYTYPLGFERLGNTKEFGDVYYLTHLTMIGANVRFGGAPSAQNQDRTTRKFTIGGDWQVSEKLKVKFQANEASGKTINNQTQLNMSHDMNRDGKLTSWDNVAIVSFDLRNVDLVNLTYYESPYSVPGQFWLGGINTTTLGRDALVQVDINDTSYERLAYYQLQRVSNDTINGASSAQIDVDYTPDNGLGWFKKVMSGIRYGQRTFNRKSYSNVNNNFNGNAANYTPDENGKVKNVYLHDVRVNPAANAAKYFFQGATQGWQRDPGGMDPSIRRDTYAEAQKIAQDLMDNCFSRAGVQFTGLSGNYPLSWPRTTCNAEFFESYFNLYDMRALNPDGTGIYEQQSSYYDITEDTYNLYLQGNFNREILGKRLFGNIGIRYAQTEVSSTGFVLQEDGTTYAAQTFEGTTEDFLPSLNANLWLNKDMILRLGLYRSLTRPGIFAISPAINNINYTQNTATVGNPGIDPIHSNSFDLSYEWYYRKDALFALALFHKNIDSTIAFENAQRTEIISGEEFTVNSYSNQKGTEIQGVEISLQHVMKADGFWGNVGFGANYTYTDEDTELFDQEGDPIPRVRLSKHSYNLSVFYDDGKFSVRLAYNWRDDFVRRTNVALGFGRTERLPEWEEARGQLDISINYNFNPSLKLNLSGVNINRSRTIRYMKYKQLQNYLAQSGARYTISLIQRF